jgi:hypothetical protein
MPVSGERMPFLISLLRQPQGLLTPFKNQRLLDVASVACRFTLRVAGWGAIAKPVEKTEKREHPPYYIAVTLKGGQSNPTTSFGFTNLLPSASQYLVQNIVTASTHEGRR